MEPSYYVVDMSIPSSQDTRSERRRRSQRLKVRISLEVRSQGADKQHISEKTETLVVNAHGALILLSMNVATDELIVVVNSRTGEEILSRVTTLGPSFMGKTEVGIEFIKPVPDFWGPAFPPVESK